MNCTNCRAVISEGLKFCGECGAKIEISQNQAVVKFHSMEELTSFINNKSQTYKGALSKILISQLEVLKSVQSPELSSLTFDLLLDNLHMAIQESESKKEKTEIQQKFSLMINAYVFFSQAKIEAASAENKRDADALLATGANILIKCVTEVVRYAITKSADPNVVVEIANNIFGSSNGKLSFIEKVVNWWRKDERIKESREVFISTVDMLVDKLNDDRELIGPSRIIHGFIKQYAPKLIDSQMDPLYADRKRVLDDHRDYIMNVNASNHKLITALWWVLGINGIIYVTLLVIWLLTFWLSFIIDWSAGDWLLGYNYIAIGSMAIYVLIALVVLIVNAIRKFTNRLKTNMLVAECNIEITSRENELNNYYGKILQYFKS